jgi:hypothetical protein
MLVRVSDLACAREVRCRAIEGISTLAEASTREVAECTHCLGVDVIRSRIALNGTVEQSACVGKLAKSEV